MLRCIGAQLEGCDADGASDRAVFGNDIADGRGLAAAGKNAAPALESAVADTNVLDGRAGFVLHCMRPF